MYENVARGLERYNNKDRAPHAKQIATKHKKGWLPKREGKWVVTWG